MKKSNLGATYVPPVAPPDSLAAAASSPTLFSHRSSQMAHQPLDSSLAPVVGDNMRNFHSFDPRREYTIPLLEDPSPGHDAWSNQVAFQQRHAFPPEQAISPWHGFHLSNQGDVQHILPSDGSSSSSTGQYLPYGDLSSYDSSNTGYSGSIDPRLTQKGTLGSPWQYPDQNYLTSMPLVTSSDQLTTAASSPASLHYQSASPAQVTGYTTDSIGSYFYHNPNYPQPSAKQRQQLASSASLVDLERHRKTSKKHNPDPRGPACPVDSCSYPSTFTRVDNFKAHYMKQHGMSSDETDAFIREWKDRDMPVASPGQLTNAASSPASLHYQNASPAQVTGYTTDSIGSYFYHNPNYPQPSAKQRQRPASSPQGWELYSSQKVDTFTLYPRLPYQPTHRSENPNTEADSARPDPLICSCGANFGRQTDLERHLRTSKKHLKDSRGPVCPVSGCSYTSRFTRVDNFKAHYMKQHRMSYDEADSFIREWVDRGRL
ncbi:hypothetical protein B9Z19DRAFT_1063977 [Tuber borchii]|uniref:C2H2-type domain-containing protein n=1 Tax=Tuber borchii TaxID=42251 RepID=A0A2T6ZWE2_TUBBO|nr:hypothetical protein B9Z19DRAFT_1063977 [Tuber borchii]